jgi:hypothetical protein
VGVLLAEKLLLSDTPKGPLRLGFPIRAVGDYFPQLFPENVL